MKRIASASYFKKHPGLIISIYHAAKNDYRVIVEGRGEYARATQLGIASQRASYLGALDSENLAYELNKIAA